MLTSTIAFPLGSASSVEAGVSCSGSYVSLKSLHDASTQTCSGDEAAVWLHPPGSLLKGLQA